MYIGVYFVCAYHRVYDDVALIAGAKCRSAINVRGHYDPDVTCLDRRCVLT